MATRALVLARKRTAHRALVDASLGHLAKDYFAIGTGGQPPYEPRMPKPLAAIFQLAVQQAGLLARACGWAGLVAVTALACSREKSGQATPAVSAAPLVDAPLAAGAPAPDVTFALHTGEQLALATLRGKPVVVYFYPKDDTPGCTVEAQEIRDLYEELKRSGAVVIGVSTDAADSHRAFAEKHALPFLLASDEAGKLAHAFGVPLKNGRASRVSFVIGADGRIKRSFPQVTPKGHAAELLAAISS
jgi:thioredoxin-dependent peroxiredoxin